MSPILCPHVPLILNIIKTLGFVFSLNIKRDKKSDAFRFRFELR